MRRGDREFQEELSVGDGPIDAAFATIEKITNLRLTCKDFEARSASVGHDAHCEATLEIEDGGRSYLGRGVSTDTIEAAIKAILNAVNRMAAAQR